MGWVLHAKKRNHDYLDFIVGLERGRNRHNQQMPTVKSNDCMLSIWPVSKMHLTSPITICPLLPSEFKGEKKRLCSKYDGKCFGM